MHMRYSKLVKAAKSSSARRAFSTPHIVLPPQSLQTGATKTTVLENGVRVVTEPSSARNTGIAVYLNSGSRFETSENNGTAHFLEHMAFKGSDKYTYGQLSDFFEKTGSQINAFTSREDTVYSSRTSRPHVAQTLDIISDMLTRPKLEESLIDAERSVILHEMENVHSDRNEVLIDLLHETAYQDNALGNTILGTAANVRSLTRSNLQSYIDNHYIGERTVVVGTGNVDHDTFVEEVSKTFGVKMPKYPKSGIIPVAEGAQLTGSLLTLRNDSEDLAYTGVVFEIDGHDSPAALPLVLLSNLIGSYQRGVPGSQFSSSRLMHAIAEADSALSVSPIYMPYKNTGIFGITAVTEPTKVWETYNEIMYEFQHLARNITDEEVRVAARKFAVSLFGDLEASETVATDIALQVGHYGRRVTPAELVTRLNQIDAATLRTTANTFFNDKEVAVAGYGAIHELPDINWFRRRTYLLRA